MVNFRLEDLETEKARKVTIEGLEKSGEFITFELYSPVPESEKEALEETFKEQVGIALLTYQELGVYTYEYFKAEKIARKEKSNVENKEESDEDIEVILRGPPLQSLDTRWLKSTNAEYSQYLDGCYDDLKLHD